MPSNRRPFDYLGNNQFRIEIEGVTQGAFTAVDGLEVLTEVVDFVDGEDLIRRKRPGRTRYANIVLRRGVVNSDELWKWYKQVIDGRVERRSGSIILLNDDSSEAMRYNFFEGWPCRWKSFAMDASVDGNLVEELEIAVEKIERG